MCLKRRPKVNPESGAALMEAKQHAKEVKARDPEVKEIARTLRQLRVNNHFSEQLGHIMKGETDDT